MDEKFLVTFGDTQVVYTEEQLSNFIKTAVIHNKDINNFKVNRLEVINVDIDEYGEGHYQFDIKEYESDSLNYEQVSLIISELANYAITTNVNNALEKLNKVKSMTKLIENIPDIRDQFEIAALRIINSKL